MYLYEDSIDSEKSEKTDEEVLSLSLKYPHYFGVLVDRYEDALMRKARTILHNEEEARDCVQDAFTKAYIAGPRFEKQEGASFKSWMYKILINTAFTKYQKQKKERGSRADIEPEFYEMLRDESGNFEEALSAQDEVFSIFARMPEQLSRVLTLQYLQGKSQQEIADTEGVSVGAVKTRVHRAKKVFERIARNLSVLA